MKTSRGQSVQKRDEAFRMVERACAAYGINVEVDGAKRYVYLEKSLRWVLSGGGGSGTLRVEAQCPSAEEEWDWIPEAQMTVTLDNLLSRLARWTRTNVTQYSRGEEAAHGQG